MLNLLEPRKLPNIIDKTNQVGKNRSQSFRKCCCKIVRPPTVFTHCIIQESATADFQTQLPCPCAVPESLSAQALLKSMVIYYDSTYSQSEEKMH
jgi:hypothetical protein